MSVKPTVCPPAAAPSRLERARRRKIQGLPLANFRPNSPGRHVPMAALAAQCALLRCWAANSERSRSSVEPWQPLRNHSDQRESSRKGKAIVTAMRSKYIYVLAKVLS